MDCLLTYRDNYLCHDEGLFHIKSNEITDPHVLYNEILCGCGVKSTEKVPVMNAKSLRPDSYEWSRLGPMGYLVEPKLNSINVCSMPIDGECHQPLNIGAVSPVLPVSPSVDILRRINDDRLRSTYQTDFGHMEDYPWRDYDDFITLSDKNCCILKKSHNVMECRERPKPPYLNGHEIPGSHLREADLFGLFGNGNREKKRRNVGPEGTNLPLRAVRLRTLKQSKNIRDKINIIPKNSINYQRNRNEIMENAAGDERRQTGNKFENERSEILENITGNTRKVRDRKLKNLLGNAFGNFRDHNNRKSKQSLGSFIDNIQNISDKKLRQIRGSVTSDVKDIKTDEKTTNNDQQPSITNENTSNPKRSLSAKKDKKGDKINNEAKNEYKDNAFSSGKPRKDNGDELELISSMPWTSEYQDIISRTADDIMKSKLHYYGKLRLITPNPDCP
ncbi:hypothetical protein PV328_000008 [Microctonus aethiopoides]|uniref:Uncharacterized protein n=1 Tax=Microctonus aethiopoides TaxID=144406 RepID=A0AA39FUN3_9HYME|nr:hypothetical protein PV328_000008 [Microctonus aethiopoides]